MAEVIGIDGCPHEFAFEASFTEFIAPEQIDRQTPHGSEVFGGLVGAVRTPGCGVSRARGGGWNEQTRRIIHASVAPLSGADGASAPSLPEVPECLTVTIRKKLNRLDIGRVSNVDTKEPDIKLAGFVGVLHEVQNSKVG